MVLLALFLLSGLTSGVQMAHLNATPHTKTGGEVVTTTTEAKSLSDLTREENAQGSRQQ